MSDLTDEIVTNGTLIALLERVVQVEFDSGNRPEFERNDKRFALTSVSIKYVYRDGKWANPWSIYTRRAQLLKSGIWGTPISAEEFSNRALITELANEYRPTTTITITETSN